MADSGSGPRRVALLVATSTYDDPGLARLVSPAQDAEALAAVLAAPSIGGFEVSSVEDATSGEIGQQMEDFAAERDRADLMLLYLSCHGLKDEQGRLYFAARNTRRDRLRSTAVAAGLVNDILFGCRSRRKVLLLDCCYSGAFAKGLAVKADPSVHTPDHFDARGLVVLTASDATQYAFEGDTLTGLAAPSVFTASVAEGLRTGAADIDRDGMVSVDDIYEYARRRLSEQPRPQSPRKWEFDVAGSIILARSSATNDQAASATSLPAEVPAVQPDQLLNQAKRPRPQQGRWWLGVLLFMATTVLASLLATYAILYLLHPLFDAEYLPATRAARIAAALGGVAWALAYAAVDAEGSARASAHDLHVRWIAIWVTVFRPGGAARFLRAVSVAVPLNFALILLVSIGAAAAGYAQSGSQGRDISFRFTYILLTTLAIVPYVVRGDRRGNSAS
jgi:hypothetical protein